MIRTAISRRDAEAQREKREVLSRSFSASPRRRYVKFGLPRVLGVNEVARMGEFQGVPVFAETGMTRPEVVYVAVRPGCEFQPFQTEMKSGAVRGE